MWEGLHPHCVCNMYMCGVTPHHVCNKYMREVTPPTVCNICMCVGVAPLTMYVMCTWGGCWHPHRVCNMHVLGGGSMVNRVILHIKLFFPRLNTLASWNLHYFMCYLCWPAVFLVWSRLPWFSACFQIFISRMELLGAIASQKFKTLYNVN